MAIYKVDMTYRKDVSFRFIKMIHPWQAEVWDSGVVVGEGYSLTKKGAVRVASRKAKKYMKDNNKSYSEIIEL